MDLAPLPNQPLSQLPESVCVRLTYIRVCTVGLWICAFGRWIDGNPLGAANDFLSSAFGACTLRDDVMVRCGFNAPPGVNCPTGGVSCLFPFALLAGVNACFDSISLWILCRPCFSCAMQAQSPLCSGCFFTFGAALLQASGCLLSLEIQRSLPESFAYGEIQASERVLVHADDEERGDIGSPEGSPLLATERSRGRLGLGGLARLPSRLQSGANSVRALQTVREQIV